MKRSANFLRHLETGTDKEKEMAKKKQNMFHEKVSNSQHDLLVADTTDEVIDKVFVTPLRTAFEEMAPLYEPPGHSGFKTRAEKSLKKATNALSDARKRFLSDGANMGSASHTAYKSEQKKAQ